MRNIVSRNGHPIAFGVGECICPPRPWEPDAGPRASIERRLGTGDDVGVGMDPILGGTLGSGQSMMIGQPLTNPSKTAVLVINVFDQNLVLYDLRDPSKPAALWTPTPNGEPLPSAGIATRATMQADGNFVVYQDPAYKEGIIGPGATDSTKQWYAADAAHLKLKMLWASSTQGHPGAALVLQDDGNLIVALGTKVLWASATDKFRSAIGRGKWVDAFIKTMEGVMSPVRNMMASIIGPAIGDPKLAQQMNAVDPITGRILHQNVGPSAAEAASWFQRQPVHPTESPQTTPSEIRANAGYGPYPSTRVST